jgi:hypothetical protein
LTISDVSLDGKRSFSAASFAHECGRFDAFQHWSVDRMTQPESCRLAAGPGVALAAGSYVATFELSVDNFAYDDAPVATVSVVARESGLVLATRELGRGEFGTTLFHVFDVPFSLGAEERVDFVTDWHLSARAPRLTARGIYLRGAASDVIVPLPFDRHGISLGGDDGDLAGEGTAFDAGWLPSPFRFQNVGFELGSVGPDQDNVLSSAGQAVPLPPGNFAFLHLLLIGVDGATTANFVIQYADGSSQSVQRSVSDWTARTLQPGERRAVAAPVSFADGDDKYGSFQIVHQAIALDPSRMVQTLVLPQNPDLRIFAATLSTE